MDNKYTKTLTTNQIPCNWSRLAPQEFWRRWKIDFWRPVLASGWRCGLPRKTTASRGTTRKKIFSLGYPSKEKYNKRIYSAHVQMWQKHCFYQFIAPLENGSHEMTSVELKPFNPNAKEFSTSLQSLHNYNIQFIWPDYLIPDPHSF